MTKVGLLTNLEIVDTFMETPSTVVTSSLKSKVLEDLAQFFTPGRSLKLCQPPKWMAINWFPTSLNLSATSAKSFSCEF